MKRLPIIGIFMLFSFFSGAHFKSTTLLETKPIDSAYIKSNGIFVTFSPFMVSSSINTDTKEHFFIVSGSFPVFDFVLNSATDILVISSVVLLFFIESLKRNL